MTRKRQGPLSRRRGSSALGVTWYRADQWPRLRAIAADPEVLEETHAAWLAEVTQRLKELEQRGISVQPVEVDVDELEAWCRQRRRRVDAAARAEFVAIKVQRPRPRAGDA